MRVPGVSDLVSGFTAFRLSTLRSAFRDGKPPILSTEGWAANAELIGRTARYARRIETVDVVERHDLRPRASRVQPWETARRLWHEAGRLRLPAPPPPAPAERSRTEAEAGAAS